ncbi:hypothetical protein ABTN02_20745, partial [Acinetobacter baumannii]
YGIDVVSVYWFYDTTTHSSASSTLVPMLEHWLNLYLTSTVKNKPKFCINYANATNAAQVTVAGWDNMIQYFIGKYF